MVRERGHRTKNRLELYLDTECILYLRVQLRMREEKPSTSIFIFDNTVSLFLCSVFKEREHDTQIV